LLNDIVTFTGFLIWAFRTSCNLPLAGTMTDGAFFQATPLFTSRAFGLAEEPVKTLNKFRKRKTLISGETMSPPIDGELSHIVLYLGESFQKTCLIQRTCIT
jgi:hypothetical protein